eukprot:scaffold593381_cov44-Prasinocladus_malaysianus.AAC.1
MLAPPLVTYRQTTEDERQVEGALLDLVEWTVCDHRKSLYMESKLRFAASGQDVAHNRQRYSQIQRQRDLAIETQRRVVESKASEALNRSTQRESRSAKLAESSMPSLAQLPGPAGQVKIKAQEALKRSVRAGRLKKAREAAQFEEILQQRRAEKEAERFRLKMK